MAASHTRPASRDSIVASDSGSSPKPKRSDLLNNKPRTTSLSKGGPAFTGGDDKTSAPCPSDPYDDE
jgi:hypothetical protein